VYSEAVTENLLAHVKLPAGWRDNASLDFHAPTLGQRLRGDGGAPGRAFVAGTRDLVTGKRAGGGHHPRLLPLMTEMTRRRGYSVNEIGRPSRCRLLR